MIKNRAQHILKNGSKLIDLEICFRNFFWFFYCGNSRYRFWFHFTTGCSRWLNSHHLGRTPKCLQGPAQRSWLPCLTWRRRCALELEQRSIRGSVCTVHTWRTGPTSRRKKSFSKDSRLWGYLSIRKGKIAATGADLRSRWQNVRHYGFSSNFHFFLPCARVFCGWNSGWLSGQFSVPELSPLTTAKRQPCGDQNKNDSCKSFVSLVEGENDGSCVCVHACAKMRNGGETCTAFTHQRWTVSASRKLQLWQ